MLEKWKFIGKILGNSKTFSISDVKVAYWLLDHRNDKTKQMYPTNRRLVKLTGLSLRQVQLSTAKLHRHKLVIKLLIKGKNHYKLSTDRFQNYEQSFTSKPFSTNKPSPPTKPTINIDINNTIKKFAKNSNPYYRQVVNNGLTYHQNMENKYIRMMSKKLSQHRYNEWLLQVSDKKTKQDALSYAKTICG
jgi:hypothetical protein